MPYGQTAQNMFENIGNTVSSVAVFHLPSLIIGLSLILATILLVVITWKSVKKNFIGGARPQALFLWLFDLIIFIAGLWFITKAFPKMNPLIVISAMVILALAASGFGMVAKKESDKTSDSGNDKGGGKK